MSDHDELLGLVSTNDLLDELRVRFDTMIFSGIQELDAKSDGCKQYYSGDLVKCLGACEVIKTVVMDAFMDLREGEEDCDEDCSG